MINGNNLYMNKNFRIFLDVLKDIILSNVIIIFIFALLFVYFRSDKMSNKLFTFILL